MVDLQVELIEVATLWEMVQVEYCLKEVKQKEGKGKEKEVQFRRLASLSEH